MRSISGAWTCAGLLPAAAALLLACPGACLDFGFPADPPGSVCVDRSRIPLDPGSGADEMYAAMYADSSTVSVHVYTGVILDDGIEWSLRHVWVPEALGYPILPMDVAILDMWPGEDGSVIVSFLEDLMIYEGRVGIYLMIDPRTGECTETWCD